MGTKKQFTLREIRHAADPAVDAAHALLRRTFPRTELVSLSEWRNALMEREGRLWSDLRWHLLVAERRGQVVGVTSGSYLGNVNIGIVGYLAVAPANRAGGVGGRLRARLRTAFRKDALDVTGKALKAIIGEVHRDNPWLKALVRRDRVLALDFDYVQPRLRRGDRPVPLVLYYESLGRPRRRLPASLLRKLLYTVWRRTYRVSHPLLVAGFRRMMAQLKGRASIGPLTQVDPPTGKGGRS